MGQSMNDSMNQSRSLSTRYAMNQSINKSINKLISGSLNESINGSINGWYGESTNVSINELSVYSKQWWMLVWAGLMTWVCNLIFGWVDRGPVYSSPSHPHQLLSSYPSPGDKFNLHPYFYRKPFYCPNFSLMNEQDHSTILLVVDLESNERGSCDEETDNYEGNEEEGCHGICMQS